MVSERRGPGPGDSLTLGAGPAIDHMEDSHILGQAEVIGRQVAAAEYIPV